MGMYGSVSLLPWTSGSSDPAYEVADLIEHVPVWLPCLLDVDTLENYWIHYGAATAPGTVPATGGDDSGC
ncbi:MAG: hypothetical protein WKF73_02450 [Nocardioidaceae bacterium]